MTHRNDRRRFTDERHEDERNSRRVPANDDRRDETPSSYGEVYGLGYGAGDRRGGYGDQFGGLQFAGPRYGAYRREQRTLEESAGRGPHYGRGPRNWRRADDRIAEDVSELLADHPELDASDLEVRVEGGEVSLAGRVASRRDKRLAEDLAERVRGVTDVHNRLAVDDHGAQGPDVRLSRVADSLGNRRS